MIIVLKGAKSHTSRRGCLRGFTSRITCRWWVGCMRLLGRWLVTQSSCPGSIVGTPRSIRLERSHAATSSPKQIGLMKCDLTSERFKRLELKSRSRCIGCGELYDHGKRRAAPTIATDE